MEQCLYFFPPNRRDLQIKISSGIRPYFFPPNRRDLQIKISYDVRPYFFPPNRRDLQIKISSGICPYFFPPNRRDLQIKILLREFRFVRKRMAFLAGNECSRVISFISKVRTAIYYYSWVVSTTTSSASTNTPTGSQQQEYHSTTRISRLQVELLSTHEYPHQMQCHSMRACLRYLD